MVLVTSLFIALSLYRERDLNRHPPYGGVNIRLHVHPRELLHEPLSGNGTRGLSHLLRHLLLILGVYPERYSVTGGAAAIHPLAEVVLKEEPFVAEGNQALLSS